MDFKPGPPNDFNPYRAPETSYVGEIPTPSDGYGTPRVAEILRQTRPWVRFLSILGFIIAGLIVLGIFAGGFVLLLGNRNGAGPAEVAILLVYLPFAVLYIAGALYLHRYANYISDFLVSRGTAQLESALQAQKSFWKLLGMTTAAIMILYLLIILGAVVFGLLAAAR